MFKTYANIALASAVFAQKSSGSSSGVECDDFKHETMEDFQLCWGEGILGDDDDFGINMKVCNDVFCWYGW